MKNILKFIYSREDKGIYRIRIIFGIKITTKPVELLLLKELRNRRIHNDKSFILHKFYDKNIDNNSTCFIFSILPPEQSGIANYSAKTFGISKFFTVFSDFSNFNDFIEARKFLANKYKNNFFPIEYSFNFKNKCIKNIFVLGNSPENLTYLKYSIKEIDKNNSYLYIHEVCLHNLLFAFFDDDYEKFKQSIINHYQIYDSYIIKEKDKYQLIKTLLNNNIYGIKIILSLTNITNIIVNNDKSEELILNEIKVTEYDNKINIIKMFLPIEKLNKENIKKQYNKLPDNIYIGSFGMLDSVKCSDTIIKAINILNKKYNNKIKLVVSGYNAKDYINSIKDKTLTENIMCFETKDTEDFISLMNSVDIAIQLRNNTIGESSGVINQLLGLNKKIITTKGFVSKELSNSVREVKPFISAEELALEILDYLEDKTIIDNSELIEKYSFENLANKLLEL